MQLIEVALIVSIQTTHVDGGKIDIPQPFVLKCIYRHDEKAMLLVDGVTHKSYRINPIPSTVVRFKRSLRFVRQTVEVIAGEDVFAHIGIEVIAQRVAVKRQRLPATRLQGQRHSTLAEIHESQLNAVSPTDITDAIIEHPWYVYQ